VPLKKKEVDDVLGGEDAWKNVQKTNGEAVALYACSWMGAYLIHVKHSL